MEVDDQNLAIACASTTVNNIPDSTSLYFLADIFGSLDAFNRIRLRGVCRRWKEMLSSRQMTTQSILEDDCLVLTVRSSTFGFNRPPWANHCLLEISLRNCQIIFKPLVQTHDDGFCAEGKVESITFHLENQYTRFDLACMVRDASDYRPDISAWIEHFKSRVLKIEEIMPQVLIAEVWDRFVKRLVTKVQDDIGPQKISETDLAQLKPSSLMIISEFLTHLENKMAIE